MVYCNMLQVSFPIKDSCDSLAYTAVALLSAVSVTIRLGVAEQAGLRLMGLGGRGRADEVLGVVPG